MATKKPTTKKKVTKIVSNKKLAVENAQVVDVLTADVYTSDGKKQGSVNLPKGIFGLPWNGALVQQVVVGMQANARTPIAHTKTRGEVRGGGKKPWKQKGTGRARHGSIRSPLWTGGGVTHGPRNEKSYAKKINRKMRTKALYTVLSRKMKDAETLFVNEFSFSAPKTDNAKKILDALARIKGFENLDKRTNAALISLPRKDINAMKSFRNFGNVTVVETKDLNPVSVLKHSYIIIVNPKDSISALSARV